MCKLDTLWFRSRSRTRKAYSCALLALAITLAAASPLQAQGGFYSTGNMNTARRSHMAVRLNDGKVLIVGWSTQIAELYDPTTETFTNADTTIYAHSWAATATLLNDGKVLIVGGNGSSAVTAELYDPVTGQFTATDSLTYEHQYHSATLLQDGRVLIAGGRYVTPDSSHAKCELYDPVTGIFSPTIGDLNVDRNGHAAVLLSDGKVLLCGGGQTTTPGYSIGLNSAELYDPASDSFTLIGNMNQVRVGHEATLLSDGKVLVTGRTADSTTEIYDPSLGTFSATGNMSFTRYYHTATRLPDGSVLVAGGFNGTTQLNSAELFDPSTGVFTTVGNLATARMEHTAALLSNGEVLVAGGNPGSGTTNTAEIFSLAPSIAVYQPTGIQSGDTKISFVITDPESSAVGILVEGSDDNGVTWNNLSVTGDTSGITYSNYDSSIVWLSGTDLPDQELWNGMLRITPHDNGGWGTADTTYLDVDNLAPQWVEAEGVTGDSTVTFWFDELVSESAATNALNYTLSGGLSVANVNIDDSWGSGTSMSYGDEGSVAGVIDGKLYVVGGQTGNSASPILEIYDPETESWSTGASLPVVRYRAAAGVIDGLLYVAGGDTSLGASSNTMVVYNPATDSWESRASMPDVRTSASAGVIGGKLYIAGGGNFSTFVYDPITDSWSIKSAAGLGKQKIIEKRAVMLNGITMKRGASWTPLTGFKLDSAPLNLPKKAVYMIGKK